MWKPLPTKADRALPARPPLELWLELWLELRLELRLAHT